MGIVRRNLSPLAFALTASAGWACAAEPAEPTASVAQAIVGGAETRTEPAVVGLIAGDRLFCSGTLIAPRAVLTAAHCIEATTPDTVVAGDALIPVRDARPHPGFTRERLNDDLALVFLDDDAPVTPARVAAAPRLGDHVRVVGYGNAAVGVRDEVPTKRAGTQRVDDVTARTFRGRPAPASPCNYDSGGAVLDAQGDLVGVISAGDLLCTDYALATRADAYRDFYGDALEPSSSDGCAIASLASRSERGSSPEAGPWLWLGTSGVVLRIIARKRSS